MALFCFLTRLYNVDEARYQEALGRLRDIQVDREMLSPKKLHEFYYRDFMLCCCSE